MENTKGRQSVGRKKCFFKTYQIVELADITKK